MRGHGEGTIYKRTNGKWRAQVTIDGKRMSKTCGKRKECQAWLKKISGQIDAGLTYDGANTLYGEFLTGWLETKKGELRIQTFEQYSRMARLYINPTLKNVRMKDLSPGRIQSFYDNLRLKGAGARTIEIVHSVVYGSLKHALQLGLVPRNPAQAAIVSRPKRSEMQVWSEAQVSQFLVSVREQRNEILYQLAFATGMRRGELLALQWKDVDWISGSLSVQRNVYRPEGGGFVYQPPKTDRGLRNIRLGKGIIGRLREQIGRVEQLRKTSRKGWAEHDLIFPSTVGTPQTGSIVSNEFRKFAKAAGLPLIRFHDIRHTAASLMLAHGIPPVIVAGILGDDLATLSDTYAHFIPSTQDQAAALMDSLTTPVELEVKN